VPGGIYPRAAIPTALCEREAMTVAIQQLMWALAGICDGFHRAVYDERDLAAAMAHIGDNSALRNAPVGTGGRGGAEVRRYLADDVLPHLPAGLAVERVSRTVDQRQVVDELVVSFVHDRELPWLLPGAAPTGRSAAVSAISVVGFAHRSSGGRTVSWIREHRTLWDHASLLGQLGLAPSDVRGPADRQARPRSA
jgi:carboxymethylenebutenolidase